MEKLIDQLVPAFFFVLLSIINSIHETEYEGWGTWMIIIEKPAGQKQGVAGRCNL